ncbi:MAG: serpin family protein, partial [Fibrobacter sp.]|nr:serpin family protein [Fibrobacter sp.]
MNICRTILSVSAIAVFIGCSSNPVSEKNDSGTEPENVTDPVKVSVAKSDIQWQNIDIPQDQLTAQVASNNEFAVKMYHLLAEDGKNLFFSSHSIINALAMTAAGAKGETQAQMRTAMQVSLDGDKFDEAVNAINFSLSEHSRITDGITLNTVNTTWAQNEMIFTDGYLDHLARYYNAGVNLLDFFNNPESSRMTINSWVEEQTNSCIKNLLPQGAITRDTRLVLTNAIYFLGEWHNRFNVDETKPAPFYLADGSNVEVPFMNRKCLGSEK